MSLLRVHKVLIAMAILLCASLAVRDVAIGDGHSSTVLRVAASASGAIVLALYLTWLVRNKASAVGAAALRSRSRSDN